LKAALYIKGAPCQPEPALFGLPGRQEPLRGASPMRRTMQKAPPVAGPFCRRRARRPSFLRRVGFL